VQKNKNIDLHLNVSAADRIELLMKSKIFVCVSKVDNGPRALVEAAQCGLPIFSMPHIGSADLVQPGETGELINNVYNCGAELISMIEKYDDGRYNSSINVINRLKPENVFPELIKKIKAVKNK